MSKASDFPPGTLVDIYGPFDRHRWVWATGYQIFNSKESTKDRHKRLINRMQLNTLTGQIEETYIVRGGVFVFPVCKSHVRKSSSKHSNLWNPKSFKGSGVILKGFVISDESDKADLESLDTHSTEV